MKKYIASILTLLFLAFTFSSQAQYSIGSGNITNTAGLNGVTTASGAIPTLTINGGAPISFSAPGVATVPKGPMILRSITFVNNSTTSHSLGIFDSGETNVAYSITSGNFASYKTNISKTFTTPNGVSQTVVYSGVWYTDVNTPLPTQIMRAKIGSASLTSGSTATVTFTGGLPVYGGIVITNSVAPSGGSSNIGISYEYEPLLP